MLSTFLAALIWIGAPVRAAESPDPAVALGLSVGIGFGTGHFYGNHRGLGFLFLITEGVVVGTLVAQTQRDVPDPTTVKMAAIIGSIARLAEITSSPIVVVNDREQEVLPRVEFEEELREDPRVPERPTQARAQSASSVQGRANTVVTMIYADIDKQADDDFETAVGVAADLLNEGFLPSRLVSLTEDYLHAHPGVSVVDGLYAVGRAEQP